MAVLKNSGDRVARELALSCIQQLKLDADLPIEQLQALIDESQESDEIQEDQKTENQETQDVLEGDIWDD